MLEAKLKCKPSKSFNHRGVEKIHGAEIDQSNPYFPKLLDS